MQGLSKEFFKEQKFLNGWSITRNNSAFGMPGEVVLIFKRAGERRIATFPFNWYFYVDISDEAEKILKTKGLTYVKGNNYIRVYYKNTGYRDEGLKALVKEFMEHKVMTYEADLSPVKRFALDKDIQIDDWENVNVLYFDIETDDTIGGIKVGRDPIIGFAGVDKKGNEVFLTSENEKDLLYQIDAAIRKYDMLIGWNSAEFDIPYLLARYKKHGLNTEYLWNILREDMMKRIQYFYMKDPEARQNISSYSLDFISNYFLKEGKLKNPESKIITLKKMDPKLFKEYNLTDCRLLKKLEDKLGIMKLSYSMFQWCQCFAQNWSMVKTIDNYVLSDANKGGIHYPSNIAQMFSSGPEFDEMIPQYLGAYVLDPPPGYYENVYDIDFKSLYPNIIRTFNISPETLGGRGITIPKVTDEKGIEHGGMTYSTKPGIIPKKIGKLLEERAQIRETMKDLDKKSDQYKNLNVKQLVVKELSNSIYGVLGNKWFRSYSIDLAESITVVGQYLIKYVKKINEEKGRKVIYGDTDSVFLILKPGEDIGAVLKWINKSLGSHLRDNFGINENTIEMNLDVKFDGFIIETKKKYTGRIGNNYKYVGMECAKRDTIPVAVNYQKKLFTLMMEKKPLPEVQKWIESKKQIVLTEPFKTEDLVIRKRLNKKVTEYKGKSNRTYVAPIHVRIAEDLMKKNKGQGDKTMEYSAGSIIKYIIIKGGNGNKMEAVHVSEFDGNWDRIYYWNNVIYPVLYRVLIAVFPKEDWDKYYIVQKRKKMVKLNHEKNMRSMFSQDGER